MEAKHRSFSDDLAFSFAPSRPLRLPPLEPNSGKIISHEVHAQEIAPGIVLIVEPGRIQSWAEFCAEAPRQSIALDGRVAAPSCADLRSKQFNFDHHIGCDRMSTPSTCRQVFDAVIHGRLFDELGEENGGLRALLHVKEGDPDVAFAVCFLRMHQRLEQGVGIGRVASLLRWEDLLDRYCGVLRCDPTDAALRRLAWVCEPYEQARMRGGALERISARRIGELIIEVADRLEQVWSGGANGNYRTLDTAFVRLGGGDGWSLIKENGFYARIGVANSQPASQWDGLISVRPMLGERWSYVVLRGRSFSAFPVRCLLEVYNAFEGLSESSPYRWGGSDFGGGSPYCIGSALAPDRIEAITNSFLRFTRGRTPGRDLVEAFIATALPERRPPAGPGYVDRGGL